MHSQGDALNGAFGSNVCPRASKFETVILHGDLETIQRQGKFGCSAEAAKVNI